MTDADTSQDNVLTKEEIDALREEMPNQGPEYIELGRSDRTTRRQLPALRRGLETLRGELEREFSRRLRGACSCDVDSPDLVGPTATREALGTATMLFRISGRRGMTHGYIAFDSVLCFRAVEAAFGGFVTASEVPEARALTEVERATLAPMAEEVLDALVRSLEVPHLQLSLTYCDGPLDDGQFRNTCVAWAPKLMMESPVGGITLVFEATFLDQSTRAQERVTDAEREAIARSIRTASLELSATLGDAELPVAELLALRRGDVVRLRQGKNDPLQIALEGAPKFEGRPLQRNGVFGLEIERTRQ